MTRKEESRIKTILLTRHNSIIARLVQCHNEEIMQLNDKIDKLRRNYSLSPAKNKTKKY